MIYVIGLICGLINAIFASGAGQILVIYLIFIKKMDTHITRATSLLCLSVITILTAFRYNSIAEFKINQIIIVIIIGTIFGKVGSKLMSNINSNLLNIISGLMLVAFSIYNLIRFG